MILRTGAARTRLVVAGLGLLDGFVSREFSYVIRHLIDSHGWKYIEFSRLWGSRAPLAETLRAEFGDGIEAILFWEGYHYICARSREVVALRCPKAIFADDLHWNSDRERYGMLAGFLACDLVLPAYADRIEAAFPEVCRLNRVAWVPHSAAPEFLVTCNPEPEDSVLLSGAINHHYPFRQAVKALYDAGGQPIVHQRHPGYHCQFDHANDPNVGVGYARTLNRHRAAITDGSRYRYILAKFFEIPATGALLLADRAMVPSLERQGFFDGEHYLSTTLEALEQDVRRVHATADRRSIDRIRRNGQALVWERHKTTDRAARINSLIDGLL